MKPSDPGACPAGRRRTFSPAGVVDDERHRLGQHATVEEALLGQVAARGADGLAGHQPQGHLAGGGVDVAHRGGGVEQRTARGLGRHHVRGLGRDQHEGEEGAQHRPHDDQHQGDDPQAPGPVRRPGRDQGLPGPLGPTPPEGGVLGQLGPGVPGSAAAGGGRGLGSRSPHRRSRSHRGQIHPPWSVVTGSDTPSDRAVGSPHARPPRPRRPPPAPTPRPAAPSRRWPAGGGGQGTRTVACYDEDATTLAVEAARTALRPHPGVAPSALWFSTTTPTYADKTNATAVHAALRLPPEAVAADFAGAARSSVVRPAHGAGRRWPHPPRRSRRAPRAPGQPRRGRRRRRRRRSAGGRGHRRTSGAGRAGGGRGPHRGDPRPLAHPGRGPDPPVGGPLRRAALRAPRTGRPRRRPGRRRARGRATSTAC